MKKIRVLVVDDSLFMRKMVTDMLQSSGVIEVVDTAKNGLEAIEKNTKLLPDIITLDVEMPKMNGLEALQEIMAKRPVPIIMLSSLTKQGTDTTVRALELGAFDFVAKPSGSISFDINKIKNELIDKILVASQNREKWRIKWENVRKGSIIELTEKIVNIPDTDYFSKSPDKLHGIVAIGTSTGGPKALQEVITKIPKDFPYAILIVQHMPPGFTKSLADRLNGLSEITVVEASDKEAVKPGTAYIAPGNYHMQLEAQKGIFQISLNQKEQVSGHRPSVDVLFESLNEININKVYVVMTGMGSDGTNGLLKAKKREDILIVEDEKTCVVYGMPKSAVKSGLVDIISPLYQIPSSIIESVQKQRGWQSWK